MGMFDATLEILSQMQNISGLSASDQQMIQEKRKTLPGLVRGVSDIWSRLSGKGELPGQDLHALYEVMHQSGAGTVTPFYNLMQGLDLPVAEGVLSPEELCQWGIELDRMSPRVPGTTSMDDTVRYLVDKLASFGAEVWEEPLTFRGVFFHEWSFEIVSPVERTFACFPENNVGFGDITAPLVDIGRGGESDYEGKDVNGKIVFVDWGELWDHEGPCAMRERYGLLHLYDLAFVHGAAGMVGYFSDTPGNALKLVEPGIKPTGGSNVRGQSETGKHRQYKLPVLNIGHDDGLRIRTLLKRGELQVHLAVKGVRKVSTTQLVVGFIPGRTSTTIACGAHSCTAFEGAVCDTVGVVGTLALAKYFGSRPIGERRKSMLFFFDSFHVWGNCCQAAVTLLNRRKSLVPRIDTLLWLDHISDGNANSPRMAITSDNPVLWPLVALSMAKRGIPPMAMPIARIWSVCATGAFERRGIPTMTVQAMNEMTLTTEDTWDKFDPAVVYRDVMLHIELAQALHAVTVPLDTPGEPIGGCGALFTETETPVYPAEERYIPEEAYPLYVGGGHTPVTVLKTKAEKQAFIGIKHQSD